MYFSPYIALLVIVAVATAITTLIDVLSPRPQFLFNRLPPFFLVLVRFALFYTISPRIVERANSFVPSFLFHGSSSLTHCNISLVSVHILIVYYILHQSLIPRSVYCTFLPISHRTNTE